MKNFSIKRIIIQIRKAFIQHPSKKNYYDLANNTSKSCIFNYLEKYMFAIKSYQIRKLYANINIPYFILYTTNNTIYSNNLHYMLHKAIYIYV